MEHAIFTQNGTLEDHGEVVATFQKGDKVAVIGDFYGLVKVFILEGTAANHTANVDPTLVEFI